MKKVITVLLTLLLVNCSLIINAQVKPQLTFTLFASGFTRPTDIVSCGDSRLFICQQHGRISIVDSAGNVNPVPFLDITSKVNSGGNEQGLLGLAFSPNYAADSTFYIDYTSVGGSGAGNTHVSRYHCKASNPNLADTAEELLLSIWDPYTNHNGGDMAFGHDGYLYLGYGDGGSANDPQNRAQNLDSLWGKILRIDVSNPGPYTIPPTNPFVNNPNARHEIWAYGVRNPWRWSFDKIKHDLWIGDVGQDLWEEVDVQKDLDTGGENYGWRCYEGLIQNSNYNCTLPNVTWPIYVYNHNNDCSITGGYVYRGAKYADLFGRYLCTDYCSGTFHSTRPNGLGGWITDTLNTGVFNDYSTFGQDNCGELYIAGNSTGNIWKIGDTTCRPTAYILGADSVFACGSTTLSALMGCYTNYTYHWQMNGNDIIGATSPSYLVTQTGNYTVRVINGGCNSLSQTIHVTIDSLPVVNLSGLAVNYCVYNSPATLTGTPSGGTFSGNGVTGNSFDPTLAGISIDTVIYTFTDSLGCTNSFYQITTVSACTGINEASIASHISIYPNPNPGEFTFEFNLPKKQSVEISITDVLGKVIFSQSKEFAKGKNQFPVKLNAESGVYFIHLKTNQGQIVRKFVINK